MEQGIVTNLKNVDGVVRCNVQPIRHRKEYKEVPFIKPFGGFHRTPAIGQNVVMEKLERGTRVIVGVINIDSEKALPEDLKLKPEEVRIQLDEETIVELRKTESEEKYNINIQASNDIEVSATADGDIDVKAENGIINAETGASGNIIIDGIDFDEHIHPYQDGTINDTGDGSGSYSSSSENTGPPE